jgi:hypothetical protein
MPTSMHAAVLVYLTANAFLEEPNPEGAPRGQVLFAASRYSAIRQATAIKSDNTVRKVLHDLQEMAYIWRVRRPGAGHQPLKIQVLWEESVDDLRERLRAGEADLPVRLQIHPEAPKPNAEVVPLRAVSTLTS